MRPPNSHTIDQTKTVMLHMRIRANMTAEDTAKILQFLTGEEED